jgi:hypothetical protein
MIKLIDTEVITDDMIRAYYNSMGGFLETFTRVLKAAPEVDLKDCVILKNSDKDICKITGYQIPKAHPMQGLSEEKDK